MVIVRVEAKKATKYVLEKSMYVPKTSISITQFGAAHSGRRRKSDSRLIKLSVPKATAIAASLTSLSIAHST